MVNNNPVAVITGASRGIGLAVAKELFRTGYSLALCSRNQAELQEAVAGTLSPLLANVNALDSRIFLQSVNVADEQSVAAFVGETIDRFQRIDVLVNNAGINHQQTWDIAPEDYRAQLEINTLGPYHLARSVVPQMLRQRAGYIFNIGSVCSFVGFPTVGAYTASKFALRGWNESLFRELVPQGIKVTLIAPSWVDTKMAAHSPIAPADRIQPDDIAATISHLLTLSHSAAVRELVIECTSDLL